ncbi:MAG: hypothetical protein HY735_07315 [Verrucomicrobia bacterium]|nr:hypothetical protein [Verrucomicrobiota bacterium]
MSLINDALKRARQARQKGPPPDSQEPALQPAEPEPSGRRPSLVILVGSAVILLAGAWFLWQWFNARPPVQMASSSAAKPSNAPPAVKSSIASNLTKPFQAVAKLETAIKEFRETNSPSPAPPAPVVSTSVVERPSEAITASPAPAQVPASSPVSPAKASNTVSAATEELAGEPPALAASRSANFPPLRLQGIYLRISKPSVLINNRTLYLGDEVDGVRVVGIERYTVKVEMKGATKELFLK